MTGISLLLAFYQLVPVRLFAMTIGAVVFANLFGLGVGWIVTNIFKIPNDGSYRFKNDNEAELESQTNID